MYKIILPKSCRKELDKINLDYYKRIRLRILELETNPRPPGCIKLSDSDEYRIKKRAIQNAI